MPAARTTSPEHATEIGAPPGVPYCTPVQRFTRSDPAALGYVVSQIRVPPEERDPQLSEIAWQNAIAGIITADGAQGSTPSDLPGRAVALREALRGNPDCALTPAERNADGRVARPVGGSDGRIQSGRGVPSDTPGVNVTGSLPRPVMLGFPRYSWTPSRSTR